MSVFFSLAIFSGLSLNLIVQLGLGMGNIGIRSGTERMPLLQVAVLFLSVPLLWLVFFYLLYPFFFEFSEYFLLFPLSALVCMGFEWVLTFLFPRAMTQSALFTPITSYDGLVLAAAVLTLRLASGFAEALILSLGFSAGVLLALLILRGIHKRSVMEKVPRFLQGVPLTLLSMGLLALIFSSLGFVFFQVLGRG
jgi:electron transport complex protein RnfA